MSFVCYFKNIGGHYESWETGVGLKGEAKDVVSMASMYSVEWMEGSLIAQKKKSLTRHKAYFNEPDVYPSAYPSEIRKNDLAPMFINRMQAHLQVTRRKELVVRKGVFYKKKYEGCICILLISSLVIVADTCCC
ncbi:beta-galactosidase 3-like protein [Tanacetum coccineum]